MNERELFEAALERPPMQRHRFLDECCVDNPSLRSRIDALLASHGQAESFMEEPALTELTIGYRPITEGPGTIIGPYKLLQKIGEGGFGVVYMAEQVQPVRRVVALKIIKPGMDTAHVVARFESERQALALMDHPNISKVLDAGATQSGRPYFVMELVKGIPITEFCDKNHMATPGRLKLFIDVCRAIQHAHHKGVIHRDIKPSNVMVTLHDGEPVVKVIDFGVAKATMQKLTERTLFTAYGQMIGTPAYMSPEQAEMSGLDIDTRSDVYALGVLLYELLTGTTPLESKRLREAGYAEVQRLIREEEPPRPSTRLSSMGDTATVLAGNRGLDVKKLSQLLASDLDWVVMKALDKDRERRYGTPENFAEDIERYQRQEAILARPPSPAYKLKKFAQRNRAAMLTVTLVTVILVASTTVATWQAAVATRAKHDAVEALARETKLRQEAEGRTKFVLAQNLCASGQFDKAEKLIEEVPAIFIEMEPQAAAPVFRAIANWNGGEQQWRQAAAHFDAIFFGHAKIPADANLDPKNRDYWHPLSMDYLSYAAVLAEIGDRASYERLRELAKETLGDNGSTAERMLNAFLLFPADASYTETLKRWGEITARAKTSSQYRCWNYEALALLEYRSNNHAEALEWGQKCLNANPPPTCRARGQVIMALAHIRLGQFEQAQAELGECRTLIEDKFHGTLGQGTYETGFWKDWLIDRALLREAQTLMKSNSARALPR